MRILVSMAVLGLLTLSAQAQTLPGWAYPVPPPLTPLDDRVQKIEILEVSIDHRLVGVAGTHAASACGAPASPSRLIGIQII
jgi:hypothetical protein